LQYLNYKGGKKKLKAVTRALRNVDRSSEKDDSTRSSPFASLRDAPVYAFLRGDRQQPVRQQRRLPNPNGDSAASNSPLFPVRSRSEASVPQGDNTTDTPRTRAKDIANERSPLRGKNNGVRLVRYGSILASPPDASTIESLRRAPTLELPDPALAETNESDPDYDQPISPGSPETVVKKQIREPPPTQLAHTGNAYEVRRPVDTALPPSALSSQRSHSLFRPRRVASTPDGGSRPFMRRMFSIAAPQQTASGNDVALEAYREVDFREAEFFSFLDNQLQKIEVFYQQKENEATERLTVLRTQLHILRDRRYEEVLAAEQRRKHGHAPGAAPTGNGDLATAARLSKSHTRDDDDRPESKHGVTHPFSASVDIAQNALAKVRTGRIGKTSQAMGQLGTPQTPFDLQQRDPDHRDYTRREGQGQAVPYRTAKRKLKIALAEYYRGLELLKSYSLLNRTAFRKINKKFDKTVNAHPTGRYMSDKVSRAHFVTSETLDGHIQAVEDLYARYFERGNHKIAVSKLRAKSAKAGAFTGPAFRTGLLAAAGLIFSLQGVVLGSLHLKDGRQSAEHHVQTSYLLQIYAGYFLMLLLVGLFVLDAGLFALYRVNYQFIFEFDTRHTLDWKQLAELPAGYFFLFGCFLWINFSSLGGGTM